MVVASSGGVIGAIVVGFVLLAVVVAKINTFRSTVCVHCGHDSGRPGFMNAICPACGLNRTMLGSKKARKR